MPNFLLLDGPLNGLYATLAKAYELGYKVPNANLARVWNYEYVLVA